MKQIFVSLAVLLFPLLFAGQVLAFGPTDFPSCVNPQGSPTLSYPSGIHGIVGNQNTFTGSDTIYTLKGNAAVQQCFCDMSGNGMQTNWLQTDGLSTETIKILESQGWIFVPDGSAWGLNPTSYLAQNMSFACIGGGGTSNGGNASNNSSSSGSNNSGGIGGAVLGAQTSVGSVLGLANTGNTQFIVGLLISGFFCLVAGVIIGSTKK